MIAIVPNYTYGKTDRRVYAEGGIRASSSLDVFFCPIHA
jgi:hypothetical protein